MLFAKIAVWWVLLSCTLGPLLTWLFFYGAREQEARQRKRTAQRAITYRPLPQLSYYGSRAARFR
jgi:hypothetical protein